MTKFDFDNLRPLCKSMFDHRWKAAKTSTNNSHKPAYLRPATISSRPVLEFGEFKALFKPRIPAIAKNFL